MNPIHGGGVILEYVVNIWKVSHQNRSQMIIVNYFNVFLGIYVNFYTS